MIIQSKVFNFEEDKVEKQINCEGDYEDGRKCQ